MSDKYSDILASVSSITDDTDTVLTACNDCIQATGAAAYAYITKYKTYVNANIHDASLIKAQIKEKIQQGLNDDI